MGQVSSERASNRQRQDVFSSPTSKLIELAAWVSDCNIPFLITSIGMIVMLLWAGSYKLTSAGAEGIILLVSHSPLISWEFKLFGPYIGSDLIGVTEMLAAIFMITGFAKPKAGIAGGLIAVTMFFTTSTMVITTPTCVDNLLRKDSVNGKL